MSIHRPTLIQNCPRELVVQSVEGCPTGGYSIRRLPMGNLTLKIFPIGDILEEVIP